jgi:predicted dehydrogenase
MLTLAKTQNMFLMEAFWTRLLPHYLKMKELLANDTVGPVKYLSAEFGFKPTPPFPPRLYDPTLGGGALLDIGVYPVFLALDVLGKPDRIEATMTPAGTGVDEQCAIQFFYNSGAIANLFCSFGTNLATGADIAGVNGRIRFTHRFHGPTAVLEYYPGIVDTREIIPTEKAKGNGYEYEIVHVNDCLRNNLKESPVLTHAFTLLLMQTLDIIRAKAGIRYTAD